MDRLVYAPKVQAYVQTETGIVDLTDFVVRGSVSRKVNEVSTAEVVIQNPDKRFTKPGNPTFRPMDSIKIYLSRFREHPVLVFTGYLDKTPYLQLHPGTCTLTASCTLKRLQYTYFDPGLQFTRAFLTEHKWITNIQGGTIYKPPTDAERKDTKDDDDEIGDKDAPIIDDGSIGNLIWLVLAEMGNWDKRNIRIENMPKGLSKTIEDLYLGLRDDDKELQSEVNKFLRDMIGEFTGGTAVTPGGGGGGGGGGAGTGANPDSETIVTPEQVGREMLYAGFPADPQVIANGLETMEIESTFGAGCQADGWGLNDYGCCAGYWQIFLSLHNVEMSCANNLRCSTKWAYGKWKENSCFACLDGPNPWQGGTDNGTKYLNLAKKLCDEVQNPKPNPAPHNV